MIARTLTVILILTAAVVVIILPKTKWGNVIKSTASAEETKPKESPQPYPKPKETFTDGPQITARSAVIIDAKSGISLYEKEPNLKHLPASTTKMMTALVAMEKCEPEDVITIKNPQKEGSTMGLVEGDEITVANLIKGMMISSANDAAFALAQNCALSESDFISKMNRKAQDLNLRNTHFVNPAGFDNDLQYSTATDLAQLARVALSDPLVAEAVKTKSTVVTDVFGLKTYYLGNVDKLLGIVEGLEGGKTGQTEGSLEILITKTTRDGNSIIVSVLGSKDRFGESQTLIEWAFANYNWK